MISPLFSIRDLVQEYAGRTVLDIERLDFDSGDIYGLLGSNGAGKTTLLKRLAFLEAPTRGTIYFQGQKVAPQNMAQLRAKVVWVPQWPVMFTGTLRYNIEYPMRLKKEPQASRRNKATRLMQAVGLEHLAESPARHLSGGEAQRASIARALAAGAEVILFDEPTAGVDYQARGELVSLIQSLHQTRNISLIITTHDPNLVAALCRKIITLSGGRVISSEQQAPDSR